jgi:hypothetical protein
MREKVFVFASNLAGRHGKGSALSARKLWGAIPGCGKGPQGQSYAIPTKDYNLGVLSLEHIAMYVCDFKEYARLHPGKDFKVVAIGCGLAGYKPEQIAPMFRDVPPNCELPLEFKKVLEES